MIYIIVPYRAGPGEEKRQDQKEAFLPHMRAFLPDATLVIAEQTEGRKFNRGAVLNAAVKTIGPKPDDILIFHDVDLLPSNDLRYAYRSNAPVMHIASVWTRYDSNSYFGGVLLVKAGIFSMINGYPADFYGWGGEDDELRDRLLMHRVPLKKATEGGTLTDLEGMGLEDKLADLRRKKSKCSDKWERRDAYNARRANRERVDGLQETTFQTETRVLENQHIIHIKVYI